MLAVNQIWKKYKTEILFQIILHGLVFWFFSFDKKSPGIKEYQVAFFLNYATAAFFINYYLLPRFLYRKSYLAFIGSAVLVFAAVIFVEELVLEKIYFPDTRGKRFPGVVYTFLDTAPLIIIMGGFKAAWDALGKQREVEALQAVVDESELQFLKSQINPHFLFNNLNNLYAYAVEQSPKTPTIILE
ncbi:MAG: histidine kinase, partial [Bacteroidota bacterium]